MSEDNQEPVDVGASASLPSSSAPRWKHDVFLSVRGADTRKGITFELYDRLQNRRGIKTFMDDQDLQVGDVISPTLLTAIKESRLAIIVLSQNYASSTWCLEELRNICECMEEDNNRILPLFYYVEPTDVRYQKRSFGDAFTKHEKSEQQRSEKVPQWRDALKKVANFSGWHTQNYRTERELLDAIEESVCNKLRPTELEFKLSIGGFEAFAATKQAIDKVTNAEQNLRATRRVDYCGNIFDISVIGKLHKLEILSMRANGLRELPREIGQLTNLRMLDVSTNGGRPSFGSRKECIGTIPSKVISKLHKLEELYMQYCGFLDWGSKIDGEGEETNVGFDELAGLSYLSVLKVCISDANCIPKSVKVEPNWVYFDIRISSNHNRRRPIEEFQSGQTCRYLSLDKTDTTIGTFSDWFVNTVVKNTERLRYERCRGLSNILAEYDRGRFRGLKFLTVLERVIEARRETLNNKKTVLPKLKNLALLDLPMLYKGSATIDFECPSLETLRLEDCPHLSFLSSASDYFHSRKPSSFQ